MGRLPLGLVRYMDTSSEAAWSAAAVHKGRDVEDPDNLKSTMDAVVAKEKKKTKGVDKRRLQRRELRRRAAIAEVVINSSTKMQANKNKTQCFNTWAAQSCPCGTRHAPRLAAGCIVVLCADCHSEADQWGSAPAVVSPPRFVVSGAIRLIGPTAATLDQGAVLASLAAKLGVAINTISISVVNSRRRGLLTGGVTVTYTIVLSDYASSAATAASANAGFQTTDFVGVAGVSGVQVVTPASCPPAPPSPPPPLPPLPPPPLPSTCSATDNPGDCTGLLVAYAAWGNKPDAWATGIYAGSSLCTWGGVTCTAGRVTTL